MRSRVELHGYAYEWSFVDSAKLSAWVAGAPWLAGIEWRAVVARSDGIIQRLSDWLLTAVPGADQSRSKVRVEYLRFGSVREIESTIAEWCGVAYVVNPFERRRRLAHELAAVPLFVIADASQADAQVVVRELSEFVETLAKTEVGRGLGILMVVAPAPDTAVTTSFDLCSGGPALVAREAFLVRSGQAWPAYIHNRLAWETGGDPTLAEQVAESLALAEGDDAGLEAALNEHSRRLSSALAGLDAVEAWCVAAASRRGRPADDLRAYGHAFAWRPAGTDTPQLIPWIARALLIEGRALAARELLRSVLVCAPLAKMILDVCFDLESRLRARADQAGILDSLDAEARGRFESFQRGDRASPARFYPRDSPARPTSEVAFASVGDVARCIRGRKPEASEAPNLALLRNAVAHGHYVSWASVKLLRQVYDVLRY